MTVSIKLAWSNDLDLWPFWLQEHMKVPISLVQIGFQLLIWPLTTWPYESSYVISINQVWFQSDFNFSIETNFTFSAYLTTWLHMTFDLGMWALTSSTNYSSHVISINQVWFKSDFKLFNWGQFCIFSLSYNLTSYDLWPWYVNFDLIKKWGFPCCTYDSNLVEIHQSMQKLQANVNPFFTTENNNRQQWTKWSLRVFPAKAGDTKTHEFERFTWKFSGTSNFINISPWQTLW